MQLIDGRWYSDRELAEGRRRAQQAAILPHVTGAPSVLDMLDTASDFRPLQGEHRSLLPQLSAALAQGVYDAGPGTMEDMMAGDAPVSAVGPMALDFGVLPGLALRTSLKVDPTTLSAGGARSTDLPDLRNMDVDEAIRIAHRNPHLIEAGAGSEGAFVGGPRGIQSRQDVTTQRRRADRGVNRGAEGDN